MAKSSLEEFYPKLKYTAQIKGKLMQVYKLWVALNIPFLQDSLHLPSRNISHLGEVKESFRIAVNARLNTLRNSYQKWKSRKKRQASLEETPTKPKSMNQNSKRKGKHELEDNMHDGKSNCGDEDGYSSNTDDDLFCNQ
jgi:hypothetical protein